MIAGRDAGVITFVKIKRTDEAVPSGRLCSLLRLSTSRHR